MFDLKFTDLAGRWRHVTLPVTAINQSLLSEGVGFDGSSVSAFQRVESGDLCLVPELETCFLDTFYDVPTLSAICSIVDAHSRKQFPGDPRFIARNAERYIHEIGLNIEKVLLGPELEFYILDEVAFKDESNHSFFYVNSREAYWQAERMEGSNLGTTIPRKSGYHAVQPRDQFANVRNEMVLALEELGIPIKYHHHEVGAPGQVEIELLFDTLVKTADAVMLMKYVIRNIAYRKGLTVTFMPKPFYGEAGTGLHVHQMLRGEQDAPLFFDQQDPYAQLSQMAYSYIAGILEHGRAICAFTNASTNSYKRLIPGFEAPTNLYYSLGNRCAAIRIPKYATAPEKKRIEFRTPDASCNVYLAFAAQLMGGIDGIIRNLDPRRLPGMGPFDQDISKLPVADRPPITPVPASLQEALDALADDNDFLKAGKVFPDELIATWIAGKSSGEVRAVNERPTPYEYRLYYDL